MRSMVWRVVQRRRRRGQLQLGLARAMYQQAMRMAAAGINVMRMSKGVNLGVERAIAALQAQARPVTGENELAHVVLTVIRSRMWLRSWAK